MKVLLIAICALLCVGCSTDKPSLKVIATPTPHAEMLEQIKSDLKAQGVDLDIITVEDYQIPNRALADKDVDANFFQHALFLETQIAQFGYPLESAASIHIEPLGAYSKKIKKISELRDHAIIAIPNDPSNQARALLLLSKYDLIELKQDAPVNTLNIISNPKKLVLHEVDAAMLARSLEDVDLAVIPTNFALQAGLSPSKDAIIKDDSNPLYTNVLVVRIGDKDRADIQKLIKALKSEKMKKFMEEKYKGSIIMIEQ
ncbi:MAG: MetQ/NlpA family ABC transporter substrate-binding protein [Chlamydiales bacterium]|nr:MetQ/NlpA family ABC transporter substrate-binding protein [Chlamydiales bacterium]